MKDGGLFDGSVDVVVYLTKGNLPSSRLFPSDNPFHGVF